MKLDFKQIPANPYDWQVSRIKAAREKFWTDTHQINGVLFWNSNSRPVPPHVFTEAFVEIPAGQVEAAKAGRPDIRSTKGKVRRFKMTKPKHKHLGWHLSTGVLGYGDGRLVVPGVIKVNCEPRMCNMGLHWAPTVADTLLYVRGSVLSRVCAVGNYKVVSNVQKTKVVSKARNVLAVADAKELLRRAGRVFAARAFYRIVAKGAYPEIDQWLEYGIGRRAARQVLNDIVKTGNIKLLSNYSLMAGRSKTVLATQLSAHPYYTSDTLRRIMKQTQLVGTKNERRYQVQWLEREAKKLLGCE